MSKEITAFKQTLDFVNTRNMEQKRAIWYTAEGDIRNDYLTNATEVWQCNNNATQRLQKLLTLENIPTGYPHRCISIYRDIIVIGEDVYKICFSCGDLLINDKHFYPTTDFLNLLNEVKNEISKS